MFILFADLTPKRIGMIAPEAWLCVSSTRCASACTFAPRWLVLQRTGEHNLPYFQTANGTKDDITSDDIYAVVEAGALAGCYVNRNTS